MTVTNIFHAEYGTVTHYEYANGFGASMIQFNNGTYEIAVLDSEGEITYDTYITNDVVKGLNQDEALGVLTLIAHIDPERYN